MLPPCSFTGFMTAPQPHSYVQRGDHWAVVAKLQQAQRLAGTGARELERVKEALEPCRVPPVTMPKVKDRGSFRQVSST